MYDLDRIALIRKRNFYWEKRVGQGIEVVTRMIRKSKAFFVIRSPITIYEEDLA